MPHTIDDLRDELFAALKGLRDKDAPLDIDRAKAIMGVAAVIVETAKVAALPASTPGSQAQRASLQVARR
jgi:hypothetical protein